MKLTPGLNTSGKGILGIVKQFTFLFAAIQRSLNLELKIGLGWHSRKKYFGISFHFFTLKQYDNKSLHS